MGGDRWCVICLEVSEEHSSSRRSPACRGGAQPYGIRWGLRLTRSSTDSLDNPEGFGDVCSGGDGSGVSSRGGNGDQVAATVAGGVAPAG
ncbi:hypothetical protein Syun_014579 [Stephania yunnanensis]|uniref:Uncharacterized protein n=1 Tax=Stephania yunnanensis TaxID=152371 RepID=A0AAP0P9R4_9MAGN